MDPIESNENKNFNNDMSIECSLPLGDTILSDFFGEQEILPRVGEEFQVKIPELVERSEYLSYIKNPEKTGNSALAFFTGLPVPLMLITQESGCLKQETLAESSEAKVIPSEVIMGNGTASGGSADVALEKKLHESRGAVLSLVPGSPSESWNDAEKASFLLGLYIFEKNFVRMRRFIESKKKMGDILAYYYGKFYRSPEYCRWSEGRKMRSRRCVYGQKIFTGMRLQELLSRILPSISDESKQTLSEVSRMFGEGKMPFEEYIFSLKAMVGMNVLVEAVGLGKGKQDLTGMALEPLRSNHVITMRPEIPTGKACSSLTPSEIVKFLTGDYRLSKARSNDLFWEAVWPRLLARGWHSEEPKDQVYAAGSKNTLVFLMPGIKKFSRRRLVKGDHYFDSVTDVLSKVASEPGLIDLENEEDQNKKNQEEYEWNDAKLEEDDTPSRRRQYLQPRTPNRTTDGMKFTVVDTSLGDGKPYKVRELRSLPFEVPNKLNSRSCAEVSDEDTSEVSTDGSDAVDTVLQDKSEGDNAKASNSLSNGELVSDGKDLEISATEQDMHIACPKPDGVPVNDSINNRNLIADKQPKNVVKHHLNQSMKEDNLDNIVPPTKRRRRLTACSRGERSNFTTNSSVVLPRLEPEMPICCIAIHNSPSRAVASQDKLSLTSSSRSSPSGSVDCAPLDNCHGVTEPQDGPQSQTLIDLNLPQVPLDFENGLLMAGATGERDDKSKNIGYDDMSHMSQDVTSSEQQSSMNPQRRSTRNRPPTTRALEALANGFLTVNSRRKKTKEELSRENLAFRSSQRARGGVGLTEVCSNSVDSVAEGSENSASIDKDKHTFPEFQVLPEENRPPISGP